MKREEHAEIPSPTMRARASKRNVRSRLRSSLAKRKIGARPAVDIMSTRGRIGATQGSITERYRRFSRTSSAGELWSTRETQHNKLDGAVMSEQHELSQSCVMNISSIQRKGDLAGGWRQGRLHRASEALDRVEATRQKRCGGSSIKRACPILSRGAVGEAASQVASTSPLGHNVSSQRGNPLVASTQDRFHVAASTDQSPSAADLGLQLAD